MMFYAEYIRTELLFLKCGSWIFLPNCFFLHFECYMNFLSDLTNKNFISDFWKLLIYKIQFVFEFYKVIYFVPFLKMTLLILQKEKTKIIPLYKFCLNTICFHIFCRKENKIISFSKSYISIFYQYIKCTCFIS